MNKAIKVIMVLGIAIIGLWLYMGKEMAKFRYYEPYA